MTVLDLLRCYVDTFLFCPSMSFHSHVISIACQCNHNAHTRTPTRPHPSIYPPSNARTYAPTSKAPAFHTVTATTLTATPPFLASSAFVPSSVLIRALSPPAARACLPRSDCCCTYPTTFSHAPTLMSTEAVGSVVSSSSAAAMSRRTVTGGLVGGASWWWWCRCRVAVGRS